MAFLGCIKRAAAKRAAGVLNRALAKDPVAVRALYAHREACNEALANDQTIQVGKAYLGPQGGTGFDVGLLGIINGVIGIDKAGWGYLAAEHDVICPAGCSPTEASKGLVIGDRCPVCERHALILGDLVRFEVLKR